jgi:hypothetical protein
MRSQRPFHVQGDAGHPVNRVADEKRIIGKRRAKEEERHKGSLTTPKNSKKITKVLTGIT